MIKPYDECYFVNYQAYDDLSLYEVGSYKCPPCYHYGPILRKHYVLHYIREGHGFLRLGDETFTVTSGQAFITPPGELLYYEADDKDPWSYIWIIFNGAKAYPLLQKMGFSTQNPLYTPRHTSEDVSRCMETLLVRHSDEYLCIGTLYQLFSHMISTSDAKIPNKGEAHSVSSYVKKAMEYINEKYAEPIRIEDIAGYCGLNRSYLTRIFKDNIGETPQQYLIRHRLDRACLLLKSTDYPILHIAYSVGYADPFAFSRLFKQKKGMSPSDYRKYHQNN